jgi:hypothetical protein
MKRNGFLCGQNASIIGVMEDIDGKNFVFGIGAKRKRQLSLVCLIKLAFSSKCEIYLC